MKVTQNNVLIKIDLNQKKRYKFSNGQDIFLSRGHEYNLRLDNPNVAEVLDAEKIPTGSLALIHHNACQDSYKAFSEKGNVFAIPSDMVFLYNFNNEGWLPNEGFVISRRVFKPYVGLLIGVEHEQVKNRMWIDKGIYSGNVAVTLNNGDYQIVYFLDGKEYNIIRTRERELIGQDNNLTDEVKEGKYLLGINSKDAKPLN